MTNNKTIVDGVDVSECEHQTYDKCAINFDEWNGEIVRYLDCSNYPNCHFKQLKRKERSIYKLKQQLQAKEQECEELKQWKEDAENLFKTQTDNADKIINRYKQALNEIKNVIKSLENENILTFPDLSLQDNVKAIMGQCNSGYKDILDIINKAKDSE